MTADSHEAGTLTTRWSPHALACLAAFLDYERARIARNMGIHAAEVTEADALWFLIHWGTISRGIGPDREGEDEFTPPASILPRDVTLARRGP